VPHGGQQIGFYNTTVNFIDVITTPPLDNNKLTAAINHLSTTDCLRSGAAYHPFHSADAGRPRHRAAKNRRNPPPSLAISLTKRDEIKVIAVGGHQENAFPPVNPGGHPSPPS
jgi:hypothetical protein